MEEVWLCKCIVCGRAYKWKDENNKPIEEPEACIVKLTSGICDDCVDEMDIDKPNILGLA